MPTIVTLTGTAVAASTLIDRAMRLISQISPGVTPTTDEYTTGLEALNVMLDSWRNEKLMCYAMQDENFTLVAGQQSYTVGSGGDFNTNRPVRIEQAYVVDNAGVSYDVTILTPQEYAAIGLKTSQATYPTYLYYAPDLQTGHIWVYPVPSAAYAMHCLTWTPMQAFATKDETAYFAPGWRRALAYNLAIELAPEYEKDPSPLVMKIANESKAWVKRVNHVPIKMYTELGALINPTHSNILTNA